MTKPLNENIQYVRIETEAGDLVPIMDAAGEKFSELINAVTSHQKAGVLKLTINVKPSTAGALAVKADVTITKPKGLPPESLLWATPKLQSPAQLEKAMKKLKLPTDRIEGLVVRNPARPTLVPVDDPRPQWIEGDIANEFDKIS